jgi:hypothetical protein
MRQHAAETLTPEILNIFLFLRIVPNNTESGTVSWDGEELTLNIKLGIINT